MAFKIIDKTNYAMKYPTNEEIFTLCELSVQIENKVKKHMGSRAYFWKRVMFSRNPNKIKK